MLNSSVFIAFIVWLGNVFENSFLYAFFVKVATLCKKSTIGKVVSLGGCHLKREGSVFYKFSSKFTDVLASVLKKLCFIAKGSFIFKTIKYFFASSIIFKPYNFLLVGIFAMFVCPHEIWNNAYGLLFAGTVLGYYLVGAVNGKYSLNAKKVWLPLILFMFATLFSVIMSLKLGDSIRVLTFFVTSFILCLAVYGMASDKQKYENLCAVIFVSLIITGLVAIFQKITGVEVDELLTDVSLNENMPGRAFSTWANPNNYAEFLILFIPFCFAYAMERKGKLKALALLLLLIPISALLFTYSRSGWIGFAVTAVTFAAIYNKKLIPLIILGGILLIPLLPASVLNRLMTIGNLKDTSSSYRIDIWTGAIDMIRSMWYRGTGLGPETFAVWYSAFAVPSAAAAPHTHMLFMEVFAEMGILGFLALGALIVSLVFATCKTARNISGKGVKLYSIAAASAMMGVMTIGFAEYVWFYPRDMFAFFIAIGMAMAAIKIAKKVN